MQNKKNSVAVNLNHSFIHSKSVLSSSNSHLKLKETKMNNRSFMQADTIQMNKPRQEEDERSFTGLRTSKVKNII